DACPPPALEAIAAKRPAAADDVLGRHPPPLARPAALRSDAAAGGLRRLPARPRPRRRADRDARAGDRSARRRPGLRNAGRPAARAPPARAKSARPCPRLALPATPLPALAADGRARQAAPEDRRRLRARARRLRLGDRHRPAAARGGLSNESLRLEQRSEPDHTE